MTMEHYLTGYCRCLDSSRIVEAVVEDGKLDRTIAHLLQIDPLFQTVQAKLPKYGFILRYPKEKEAVTKIGYESWHFRYIDSPEIAQEITARGICFEEYWEQH